jgi:hypothetical protein
MSIFIRLLIPANEVKMIPPFSVIFGQYQLPGQKISTELNKLTGELYFDGVPVRAHISKSSNTHKVIILHPPIFQLLRNISFEKKIEAVDLFDVLCILKELNFSYAQLSEKKIAHLIFSALSSSKNFYIKVNLNFKIIIYTKKRC